MTDDPKHSTEAEHGSPPAGVESEFSIAQSKAIVPILVLFGATVLMVLLVIARAKPVVTAEGALANKAYGPADFANVFGPEAAPAAPPAPGEVKQGLFPVAAPPFSEGIFPCMDCHDSIEANPERRVLEDPHDKIVLKHDEEHRWCLDCHDAKNRDFLHLAGGALVPFTESYRLCGQCHGTQFRDWKTGIHGKRTGYWNGAKRYLLCVNCHSPHNPRFAALKPLPPPMRPQFLLGQEVSIKIPIYEDEEHEESHGEH